MRKEFTKYKTVDIVWEKGYLPTKKKKFIESVRRPFYFSASRAELREAREARRRARQIGNFITDAADLIIKVIIAFVALHFLGVVRLW